MVTETEICKDCGASFDFEPCRINGREMLRPKFCDACLSRQEAEQAASKVKAGAEVRNEEWNRICPVLFRETAFERIPREFQAAIRGWKYGPRGVGLFGEAGQCKTRAALEILKIQHFDGKKCAAISATRLSMLAIDQFSDSRERKAESVEKLKYLHIYNLLLLNNLKKSKITKQTKLKLFNILDQRTSGCLPTIWTANASAKALRSMMSEDRGDPIMRRLTEFSEIIRA